jgi:hypothetical protein
MKVPRVSSLVALAAALGLSGGIIVIAFPTPTAAMTREECKAAGGHWVATSRDTPDVGHCYQKVIASGGPQLPDCTSLLGQSPGAGPPASCRTPPMRGRGAGQTADPRAKTYEKKVD